MTADNVGQNDLLSDVTELDLVRHLLADLHDDLIGKIARFRQLTDFGLEMGRRTMIFGGHAAHHAWIEARSSFVHGNYAATVLLCQSLVENLLAAFLRAGLLIDDLPERIAFRETLRRCCERGVISDRDAEDLSRLMELRNPLSHFRDVHDVTNLDRRAILTGETAEELLSRDAVFAIGLAVRMLAKPAFRLG